MMKKRTLIQYLLSSTLVVGTLLSTTVYADTLDDIKKSGALRVAVPQDFMPFGSVGPDLKPVGYDIDVASLIAKSLGVRLELIPVTSANRIPYLSTKKVDLVISSLGKNPERELVIDFAGPYAPFYNGAYGAKTEKVTNAAGLASKTLAVTRGSIEDLELTKIAPSSTVIKRFEDNNSTVSAYYSGQVQLIATGNVVAAALNYRLKRKPLETKFIIKDSPCYIGLNKDEPALKAKVSAIIATAKKDGTLNKISMHWLSAPLPAGL